MPTPGSPFFAAAVQHYKAGRLKEAEKLFRRALSTNPKDVASCHGLGLLAFHSGRLKEAAKWLKNAVLLKPDYADAQMDLGCTLTELGRRDEAVFCFHKVLELQPDDAAARFNLGIVSQEMKRLDSVRILNTNCDKTLEKAKVAFNICHISINEHDRIFSQIIGALRAALIELRHECTVTTNSLVDGAVNIVVGSIAFASRHRNLIGFLDGQTYVLYNFEQLNTWHGHLTAFPEYLSILESAAFIFEYSLAGMVYFATTPLINKVVLLPPLFHHSLESFKLPKERDRDIDVLFYGSHSERRHRVMDELRDNGKNVAYLFNVYGNDLIEYIKRSKIVINIHCWDDLNVLETPRISYLLANKCFVVSEAGEYNPYGAGVVYSTYKDLAATCLEYLGPSAERRASIAAEGYAKYRRSELVVGLRRAISQIPIHQLVSYRTLTGSAGGPHQASVVPRTVSPPVEKLAIVTPLTGCAAVNEGLADLLVPRFVRCAEDGVWRAADAVELPYSDGDTVEARLLAVVRAARDIGIGSEELEAQINDWPSLCHLSATRANLLRPLAGMLRGRVLEIGAGCGPLTRYLGEAGTDEVVAVEGSRRRAAIAAARCRDLPGVAVVAGRVQDLGLPGRFDVVTLIGVLEWARAFAAPDDPDPVASLLSCARACLRPGGVLMVAIENQLGLKYFALYPEDHFARPLIGLEDRYGARTPVTFGRTVLTELLQTAGLGEQAWYFPLPDYKLPTLVLTEAGTAGDAGDAFAWAIAQTALADPQRPAAPSFAVQYVWPTVYRNRLAGELANSFLVVASDAPVAREAAVLATYFGGAGRRRALQKQTRFVREADGMWVRRAPLYPGGEPPPGLGFTLADEPLWKGRVLEEQLIRQTGHDGWRIAEWAKLLVPWLEALRREFGLNGPLEPARMVPARAIDALPRNLVILPDGTTQFIDREWQPDGKIPLGFVCFRAVLTALQGIEQCAPPAEGQSLGLLALIGEVFAALGWELPEADLREHVDRELAQQAAVNRESHLTGFEQVQTFALLCRNKT